MATVPTSPRPGESRGQGDESPSLPRVSVVVPTRARPTMLVQCVESILGQDEPDLELIVVVDGECPSTLTALADIDDTRLRVITHTGGGGVGAVRNTGIGNATGRWLAFCDDDDLWAPTKVRAQLDALAGFPDAKWCLVGEIRIVEGESLGRAIPIPSAEEVRASLPHSNRVPAGCSGVMAERRLVTELGCFDERLSVLADFDLWIRLGRVAPVAVAADHLVVYRHHPGQMTRKLRYIEREVEVVRANLGSDVESRQFPGRDFYEWVARRVYGAGDLREVLRYAARSTAFRRALLRVSVDSVRARIRRARTSPAPVSAQVDGSIGFSGAATTHTHPWIEPITGPTSPHVETAEDDAADRSPAPTALVPDRRPPQSGGAVIDPVQHRG